MKIKLFGREFEFRAARTADMPPIASDESWQRYLEGRGYEVDAMTALKVSAVFRCVDVVAKTIASLPLHLFRETETGKERARELPLYRILYALPNAQTTAYEFWHMFVVNLLLTRGGFAAIVRDRRGFVTGLRNLPTARVAGPYRNTVSGERYIVVTDSEGAASTLREGEYMYTPALRIGSDLSAEDPVRIAGDVLGLTVDLCGYARASFEEGTNPGGFIEHPGALSDKAFDRFKDEFARNYSGVANAHKWIMLEEGAKASPFSRDMQKNQVLESRKFAVVEICRIFGVPPHLVYDLDRATFSNIEQQSIEFVQNCVSPFAVRLEQMIYRDLLTAREKETLFAKFNINGLLRGDMAARTAYYNSARNNGWLNGDEIRRLEDINDMPDGLGQIYTVNGNMIPLSAVPQNMPKGARTDGGKTGNEGKNGQKSDK